jgi:hypothetical protein
MAFVVYSSHKSQQAAYDALENMYASGEISECEPVHVAKRGNRWCVMVAA